MLRYESIIRDSHISQDPAKMDHHECSSYHTIPVAGIYSDCSTRDTIPAQQLSCTLNSSAFNQYATHVIHQTASVIQQPRRHKTQPDHSRLYQLLCRSCHLLIYSFQFKSTLPAYFILSLSAETQRFLIMTLTY